MGPLLYTLSCMHCMTVSLAANGAGLGAMWGKEKAREMLQEAGFTSIEVKKLPHDFQAKTIYGGYEFQRNYLLRMIILTSGIIKSY